MKRKAGVFLVVCIGLLLMFSCALARDYASVEIKTDKLSIRAGDTLKASFVVKEADRLEYTIYGYEKYADGVPSGEAKMLATGPDEEISYRVNADDGACLEIWVRVYQDSPDGSSVYWSEYQTIPITAESTDAISVALTPDVSSVRRGGSVSFSYAVSGGSGSYASIQCNGYSSVPGGKSWYVLEKKTLTDTSGTVTYDDVTGEEIWVTFTVTDQRGFEYSADSAHVPINNINVGKKNDWAVIDGKTYYGDEFGYAVTGLREINGERYFFDENCVLQTGRWVRAKEGQQWLCAGEDGKILKNAGGMDSLYVPAEVDSLAPSFFAGVERTFMIRCEPGSYAEKLALQYGLQYTNGSKTVRGCDIDDLDTKVRWIVDNYTTAGMSQREKALVLHNWLIFNAAYDETYTIYNPEGVLLKGAGVCDSYSKAYGLLLDRAGIENRRLTDSKKIDHAWNLVRIDGQWYHVDCTWDDPTGGLGAPIVVSGMEGTHYFLVGDAFMLESREFDEKISADKNNVRLVTLGDESYYYGDDGKRAVGWATVPVMEPDFDFTTGQFSYTDKLRTYYFDERGVMVKSRWLEDDGVWYYLTDSGVMATGQVLIGSTWYRFADNGAWQPYEWVQWDGRWYCMDASGDIMTGWVQDGGYWYWMDASGAMRTGWVNIAGSWYYMDASGKMQTGWLQDGGKWYYLGDDGARRTGWAEDAGSWYYMDASGVMQTGWKEIGGTWYCFSASGVMQTGWIGSGGSYWYLGDSGAMVTGWLEDNGTYYYLGDDGLMVTGWNRVGGVWYFFAASGAMETGWVSSGGQWYYFKDSGAMATGWFRDRAAEKKLPKGSEKELWYWAEDSGAIVTGWKEIDGVWQFFDDSGLWQYTWDGN